MRKQAKATPKHLNPQLLGELLSATAAQLPNKEALVFHDQRVTWSEFNRRADYLAKAFLEMGVQRGDRIGVISTTRPEYLYVYLAAVRIGAVLVGFSILYTPPELIRLAELTKPVAMVVLGRAGDKPLAESLKALIDALAFVRKFIVIGEGAPNSAIRLDDLMAIDRPEQDAALSARKAELEENDAALIVFTSGSTGVPKGAVLTHKNIIANISVQVQQFGSNEQHRTLLHLPMNHVAGATETTVPALITGGTLVLMDHFHPVQTLQTIQRERVTVLGQVPTMFIMELNLPNFTDFDLSSLCRLVVGGAPTPTAVMSRMMRMEPEPVLRENWEKLHSQGTRKPDHPLARDWPRKFPGSFDAYRNYSFPGDAQAKLKKNLIKVSAWANAVLNQHCLRYNFAQIRMALGRAIAEVLFVAKPLTAQGSFTEGIEGPACDAQGNIYAVNFARQQTIGKVTPDGQAELFVQLPGNSTGNGIRFDRRGRMYIADYVGHNVLRVDLKARAITVFAHNDKMNQPNDLTIAPGGTFYASDPN